jgi:alkylhydroperoxidase family enzyme
VEKRAAVMSGRIRASGEVGAIPADLSEFVDRVAVEAWRVTSEEVKALLDAGYTEDEVFEVTVSAAMGAACGRLERGLAALRGEV